MASSWVRVSTLSLDSVFLVMRYALDQVSVNERIDNGQPFHFLAVLHIFGV